MTEQLYILGGSGFVGKHLSRYLSQFYKVTIFDRWIDSTFFSFYPSISFYEIDLIQCTIPDSFATPSYIINLASPLVTATRELDNVEQLIAENLTILTKIYHRFKDDPSLKLLMQFGSVEEYGTAVSPFKETDREYPNSAYALMKQASTNLAIMMNKNFEFPAMVVRPGNLFGKYQTGNRFIPYVFHQLSNHLPLELTPCEQKRDFVYIDDFSNLMLLILKNHEKVVGEIINVSSGRSVQLKMIVEELKALLNSNSEIFYGKLPYRENEAMDLGCNISKLREIININDDFEISVRLNDYMKSMQSAL